MEKLFIHAVNLSISASWLILAVLVLRFLLKKAPKWLNMALWGIVAVRLLLPFSWESALSLVPSTQTIPREFLTSPNPGIDSGMPAIDQMINPMLQQQFTPAPGASANPLQIWTAVLSALWLAGIGLMLLYTLVTYLRLRHRVRTAVLLSGNLYQSEAVSSPFVLGLIRPRIYLPFCVKEEDLAYVVAHEKAHIARRDHWWKPLGFVLLSIYWFNPVLWVAYIFLCRDIELACDERVIRDRDINYRANYSQALLSCSVSRRSIAACPLAFGEVGVKQRIKSVLNYKKPAFWIILVAVVTCIVVTVCFLSDPQPKEEGPSVSGTSPSEQTKPSVQPTDLLNWAHHLKAEDVEYVTLFIYDGGGTRYALLNAEEVQAAVKLVNQCAGTPTEFQGIQEDGGQSVQFWFDTKDGRYIVGSHSAQVLEISGCYFAADKEWLNTWYGQWSSVAENKYADMQWQDAKTYTFQTGEAIYALEKLSAQVSLDTNGRLMIWDSKGWGLLQGKLYAERDFRLPSYITTYLPNFWKTCQEMKNRVGQPGSLWICPYSYPTSGIIYEKHFLLYQTEDGGVYLGATKFQTGQENDDKLLYVYALDLVHTTTQEPLQWAQNLKAEEIVTMTLEVRGETYHLESGSRMFQKYLANINRANGQRMDTMTDEYGFNVTILVDTVDGKRHIVVNDSGEKLMIDGYYYQADATWLKSWWEEWRKP